MAQMLNQVTVDLIINLATKVSGLRVVWERAALATTSDWFSSRDKLLQPSVQKTNGQTGRERESALPMSQRRLTVT